MGFLFSYAGGLSVFIKSVLLPALGTELLHCTLKAIVQPLTQIAQASGWLDADTWSVMSQYCEDLTQKAKEGHIHDAVGRDKEINAMIDILTRNGKGNPCAVGEAGVGKTALVEGLAYRIATGNVPDDFKNKKIIKVNMVSLIAGKSYNRGAGAVGRIRALFDAASKDPNVILFIDEFHQIVQCNAAELFKTYLDRGNIKVIAATTTSEYAYIERDPALDRRFSRVFLEEPSQFETFQILKGIKDNFEEGGKVHVTDEALTAAVELTGRYMKNRTYPDKAIDVISSASKAVYRKSLNSSDVAFVPTVVAEDVQAVVSAETGMPIGGISDSESKLLKTLEKRLESHIKGQSEAIHAVSNAIKRSRIGITDSSKPRASFLFTGASGVGKHTLAQYIGKEIGNFIKIDLEQCSSKSSFLEKNGKSLEQVWKKPYSVVLFDKIDHADQRTINMISGILENGYIVNQSGNKIDFSNTIVIITTNVGSKNILDFSNDGDASALRKDVVAELEKAFGLPILNRVDEILIFNKLTSESFKDIVNIFLESLEHKMKSEKINLVVDKSVADYISSIPINHKSGARQIQQIICEQIEKPIANMIVQGTIKKLDTVDCSWKDGKIALNITHEYK